MKKPRHKYRITVELDVIYKSSEAHDQPFYAMFVEIFQTAQQEYRKYEFSLDKMSVKEKEPKNGE